MSTCARIGAILSALSCLLVAVSPVSQAGAVPTLHADHIYGLQAFKDHAGNPPVWAQQ